MAWQFEHGEIPYGMEVLHTCERFYAPGDITCRRCVRHLKLGTHKDNSRDAFASGRMPRSYFAVQDITGEKHPLAKLTWDIVDSIRAEFATGQIRQKELASKYGIDHGRISTIVNNKVWKREHRHGKR